MKFIQNLQEKYPHLEISVLTLSEVQGDNENFRIDDKFFMKRYINLEQSIIKLDHTRLREISLKITDGTHNTPVYQNDGVPFLSSLNIAENYLNFEAGYKYISHKEHKVLSKRCLPQEGDILLRKIGGEKIDACVVPKLGFEFSVFVSIALVRIQSGKINPYFLSTFINSNYGRQQLIRHAKGIAQLDLHLEDLAKLKIPLFPMSFQLEIEKMVKDSHQALEQSKALYREAESLLYESLGLDPKDPLQSILESSTHHKSTSVSPSNLANYTIKTLEESFLKTGRLDSEYYQGKYESIESCIKNYRGGFCKLKDIVVNYSGGFAFPSDKYLENGNLALIRINNIKNANLDMDNAVYLDDKALSLSPKDKVNKGDILISMSGSIGLSCVVRENLQAMVNQRILKINIKDFSKDVLVLVLNSVLCKLQFERIGTGGVQTNVANSDILNLFIPKIDIEIQNQIANYIQKSFDLRAQAKELLTKARESVEIAICKNKNIDQSIEDWKKQTGLLSKTL